MNKPLRQQTLKTSLALSLALVSVMYTGIIFAHSQFKIGSATPPRYNTPAIKTYPPCGNATTLEYLRTNRKAIFISGETITVEWKETVDHPGSFRFDLSPTGDEEFTEMIPPVADTQDGTPTPHYYSQSIQLNYPPCETCTLRLRQDMSNREDFYYSCADIVIVSGNDITPPQEVTALMASLEDDSVHLTWATPADSKGIIVLRNTATITDQPSDRKDYLLGDTIGGTEVVYKGAGASFTDTNVAAATEYTYKVFAYDADYNYNSGASQSIATTDGTNSGGGSGGEPGAGNDTPNTSGGGAWSWALILLLTLLIFQRPTWRKLP